jgi:PAS domain S-box-containing protein
MTSSAADSKDPLDLGVDAAEIGTWNWHIRSGRVDWTSWTYQLFGFQPGGIVTSHELFLRRVHAPDRPVVLDWISRAMKERRRTSLEFRIERADGTVRWIRSTGRVLADQHGDAERMIGVAEDVTEFHRPARAVRAVPLSAPGSMRGFSAREVAQMLGVAEVTVKRLAASGEIRMFRSSKKNTRRFAADHIVEYLGKNVDRQVDFESSVAKGDITSCIVHALDRLGQGTSLEALLDEARLSTTQGASSGFIDELLSRLPFMIPDRQHSAFPALLVQTGNAERQSAVVRCVLHARGYDVLRAAGNPDPVQLAEVARRVRARFVILVIGADPPKLQKTALSKASCIADQLGPGAVLAHVDGTVPVPDGVTRFQSMRELGTILG